MADRRNIRLLGVFGAVLIACVVWRISIQHRTSDNLGAPVDFPSRSFRVDLVTEEACAPGKIVRAIVHGKTVAEYPCAPLDSAAAWIEIHDQQNGHKPDFCSSTASDDKGNLYWTATKQIGDRYLVRVANGYAHQPGSISVRIDYGRDHENPQNSVLKFTHLAEPKIVLAPLNESQRLSAQKLASASFISGHKIFAVNLLQPSSKDEFIYPHVLATSYCEGSGGSAATAKPLPIDFMSAYGNQTETVMLKLQRYRVRESLVKITYKNARLSHVNDVPIIECPTTQELGEMAGIAAKMSAQSSGDRVNSGAKHIRSVLTVDLGSTAVDGQSDFDPNSEFGLIKKARQRFEFESISPSLQELGLEELSVELRYPASPDHSTRSQKEFSQTIRNPLPTKSVVDQNIGSLSLTFKVYTPEPLSFQVATVPINHRGRERMFHMGVARAMRPGAPTN